MPGNFHSVAPMLETFVGCLLGSPHQALKQACTAAQLPCSHAHVCAVDQPIFSAQKAKILFHEGASPLEAMQPSNRRRAGAPTSEDTPHCLCVSDGKCDGCKHSEHFDKSVTLRPPCGDLLQVVWLAAALQLSNAHLGVSREAAQARSSSGVL